MANVTLLPHQEKTIQYGLDHPYCIFALDMGLGKTLCSLEVFRKSDLKKLLVVAPAYLVPNWNAEIEKFYGTTNPRMKSISTFDGKKERGIFICSYDFSRKNADIFDWADMVVSDEAHYLKALSAKRTESFHKNIYENSIKRLLLLTGTPIKNRVAEYYSLICLCNYRPGFESKFLKKYPDEISFADTFSFRQDKIVRIKTKRGAVYQKKVPTWSGLRNQDILKHYIKENYIRFEAKDCLNLPETIHKEVLVSKSPQAWLEEEFEKFDVNNASVLPAAKKQAALLKVKYTEKYVKDLLDEGLGPVIVYTDHVDSCVALGGAFGTEGIHGATSIFNRYRIADSFKKGQSQVLVATIGAFSTGVSLIEANNLVFNDIAWVSGDLDQAIGRIVRVGQTKTCVVHYLLGSPQDQKILKRVKEKAKVINEVSKL